MCYIGFRFSYVYPDFAEPVSASVVLFSFIRRPINTAFAYTRRALGVSVCVCVQCGNCWQAYGLSRAVSRYRAMHIYFRPQFGNNKHSRLVVNVCVYLWFWWHALERVHVHRCEFVGTRMCAFCFSCRYKPHIYKTHVVIADAIQVDGFLPAEEEDACGRRRDKPRG